MTRWLVAWLTALCLLVAGGARVELRASDGDAGAHVTKPLASIATARRHAPEAPDRHLGALALVEPIEVAAPARHTVDVAARARTALVDRYAPVATARGPPVG